MNVLEKILEEIEDRKSYHEELLYRRDDYEIQKMYCDEELNWIIDTIRSHMNDATDINVGGKIEEINKEMEEYLFKKYCIEGFDEELDKIFQKYLAIGNGTNVPSKWIPVKKRLPEESLDSVIGWDKYRERCVFVQFRNGRWIFGNDIEPVLITAWRTLPEPYKGD